jgi:hypothetical protein
MSAKCQKQTLPGDAWMSALFDTVGFSVLSLLVQSGVIRFACRQHPQVFLRCAQQEGVYYRRGERRLDVRHATSPAFKGVKVGYNFAMFAAIRRTLTVWR